MMGVARKLFTTIRTTGHLDPRGRKPAAAGARAGAVQQASGAAAPLLAEKRTERRAAARAEKVVKPK